MSKTLNFNNVTKRYLTVTLADENNTTVMVAMPTRGLLRELTSLRVDVNVSNNEEDIETIDELYSMCAKIMSRNKAGVKITKEYLEEIFDFEDILIFLREYMAFIGEVAGRKN